MWLFHVFWFVDLSQGDTKRKRGKRNSSTFMFKESLNRCDGMGLRFVLAS
jgi:hypothetical protein